MTSSGINFNLSWMSELLNATEEIHTRSGYLINAAARLCEWLDQQGLKTSEIAQITEDVDRLESEIQSLELVASTSDTDHQSFRALVLRKAIVDGNDPDPEAALKLVHLEIAARRSQELLDSARSQLASKRNRLSENTALVGIMINKSIEIQTLKIELETAKKHQRTLSSLMKGLGIDLDRSSIQEAVAKDNRFASLIAYQSLLDSLEWVDEISPTRRGYGSCKDIHRLCEESSRLQSCEPVDASLLFCEICIVLAQRHIYLPLDLPDQPPTKEDLTEF